MRVGDKAVRWRRGSAATRANGPWLLHPISIRLGLTFSRPASRPVWLVLRLDGRVAARRLLLRQMSDLSAYERETLRTTASFGIGEPGEARVPDLSQAAEITISAEEEGGEPLATNAMPLPGAERVGGIIARLAPALDGAAADYRNRCQDTAQPLPVPSMPRRPAG
jgi:hypothetical protein